MAGNKPSLDEIFAAQQERPSLDALFAEPQQEAVPSNPMGADATPAQVIRNAAMGRIDRPSAEAYLKSVGMDPKAIDNFGKDASTTDVLMGMAQKPAQGLTFGWADDALAKVLPANVIDKMRTQSDLAQKTDPGGASAAELFGTGVGALAGGEVIQAAGKLPFIGPLTSRALALLKPSGGVGKVLAGGASGATGGAISGYLHGKGQGETPESKDRLAGEAAGTGALFGGAVGAAAPVVSAAAQALTQPMKKDFSPSLVGKDATGIDDVGKFAQVQKTLADKYSKVSTAEENAWNAISASHGGKALSKEASASLRGDLSKALVDSTSDDAANAIQRQIDRIDAHPDGLPVNQAIAARRVLSKSSVGNGSLRAPVEFIDGQLKKAGIPIDEAVGLTKKRIGEFDEVAPIAAAMGENATAADFGKAVFGSGSVANATKAAQRVKEIMRASGDAHLDVKQALDQAVVHRILQTSTSGGEDTVWLGKAAREVNNLRQKNPEMWGMLSKDTQEGLLKLRDEMLKNDKAGKLQVASQGVLWALNKALSPFGAKQVVKFPSTAELQTRMSFDEVKKLMNLRPDEGVSAWGAIVNKLQGK